MKRLVLVFAIFAAGCDQARQDQAAAPAPAAPDAALPTQAPASQPSAVVALPADEAQLDRMILAGYTPHADHLHPPGVNECPLTQGSDAVM